MEKKMEKEYERMKPRRVEETLRKNLKKEEEIKKQKDQQNRVKNEFEKIAD